MRRHIAELDGIRGIAIIMVVVWHYFTCQPMGQNVSPIVSDLARLSSFLWSGVDLFFVLSGFLIGGILIDNRKAINLFKVFVARRACRILPVYVLVLLCYFVLRNLLDPVKYQWLFHRSFSDIGYLTFTQNILMGQAGDFGGHFLGMTWSLSIEEQFYLAMPILISLMAYRKWIHLLIALTLLAPVLRGFFPGFHTFVNMPFRMDSLLMGALVSALVRNEPAMAFLKTHRNIIPLASAILFAGVLAGVASSARGYNMEFFSQTNFALFYSTTLGTDMGFFTHTYHGLFYSSVLLFALLFEGHRASAALRSAALRFMGRISYGLYMFHAGVSGLLHITILGRPPMLDTFESQQVTILSLFVSIALATLSYYTFERFFLKLGRKRKFAFEEGSYRQTAMQTASDPSAS